MKEKTSLKNKAICGIFWSAVERFLSQGIQFVVTVIMARFLLPSDYGMVGMLAIVLQLSQTLMDSGFTNALIRYKERTEIDYSTVFFFNILASLVIYFLIFFLAPYISWFYKIGQLVEITRILSIVIVLNSFAIIPKTKLIIAVDFKTQSKVSFIAALVSGIIGIWAAYLDFGVWALVGQTLVNGLLIVVLYAYFCRWKPLWIFSLKSFRLLFAFGSKLVLANILNTLYKNLYAIVIGKKFSSVDLGFYTRAEQFAQFPSYNLSAIISRVTYPILSLVQNDNDRLSALYRKYVRLSSAFIFPLMILLIVIAQPLVLLLLTEKWIGVVVLLQILCLDWMFDHLSSINLNLLYVKGRSDLALRLEVIKKVLATGILLLSIPWGIVGMCWERVMYSLIAVYLNTYYTESLIKLSLIRQMRDILPSFFLALIMGGGTWYMILLLEGEIVQIVVGSVIALLLYGTLLYCFSRSLFDEIWAVILKIKR